MSNESSFQPISLTQITEYMFNISKILQNASTEDIIQFNSEEFKTVLQEFLEIPLAASLFISKLADCWKISLSLKDIVDDPLSTIVAIKDKGILNSAVGLDKQLQIVILPNMGTSLESLKSLVSLGVGSYFEAITSDNQTEIVNSTRRKITELALSLENLEQNIQIPDLNLTVHPTVKNALNKGANLENFKQYIHEDTLMDPKFLNNIQNIVNGWVKLIQSITKHQREVSQESALDEVNYWISMENALNSIQDQLNSASIQLTLEILKHGKRFHATTSFLSDIGIKNAMELTTDYNKLMKDLPLKELVSSQSLKKIEESIILIMNHMKKLRLTTYPISRSLPFVQAISSDVERRLTPLSKGLMELEYDDFNKRIQDFDKLFDTWDRQLKEFTNLARELLRKRGEKFIFVKINSKTDHLKRLMQDASEFRITHNEFVKSVQDNNSYLTHLDHAYDAVRKLDLLSGEKQWSISKKTYNQRLQLAENGIIQDIRSSLQSANNANEMFSAFESFKNLLERPRVRGAIQEYQSQLLSIVRAEISLLQSQFSSNLNFQSLSDIRDYPPIAFALLRAKQIDHKFIFLLERLELVLGRDWSSYADGKIIYNEVIASRKQLNLQPLFDEWTQNVSSITITGNVLKITKDSSIQLQLNFDNSLLSFFKEVRALSLQGFLITPSIITNSRQIRKVYPYAIILKESLVSLNQTLQTLDSLGEFGVLLSNEKLEVYEAIIASMNLSWENVAVSIELTNSELTASLHNQVSHIERLENLINTLAAKTNLLISYREELLLYFESLKTCDYSSKAFTEIIQKLQKLISKISIAGLSNMNYFVRKMNEKLKKLLADRYLKEAFHFERKAHSIYISSTVLVTPSLESSKVKVYHEAQKMLKIIFSQPQLVLNSLDSQIKGLINFSDSTLYDHLHAKFTDIEEDFIRAKEFVNTWSQFQILWDLQSTDIYKDFTIEDWLGFLEEIRDLRASFGSPESAKIFSYISIDFSQAREHVITKFNLWSKELLNHLSSYLNNQIKATLTDIEKGRKLLESINISLSSIQETISAVTNVERYKSLYKSIEPTISKLKEVEVFLIKQRFRFPEDQIHIDQLEAEYDSLVEIVSNRQTLINENKDHISKSIENECQALTGSIVQLKESWIALKPVDDAKDPNSAMDILDDFETKARDINSRKKIVSEAASSLGLLFTIKEEISALAEEIKDLKLVWLSIQNLWTTLQAMKQLNWDTLKPHYLRKQLEKLLSASRGMPARVKQHYPFQQFLSTVTGLINSQKFVLSLKEAYIKDRHLKSLFTVIGVTVPSTLTLGYIWDLNLGLHQNIVDEIIQQAIAESSIEESLESIQKFWNKQSFEFFDFNGNNLVKNLPHLAEVSHGHIDDLLAMKNSAVYKVFERDIADWELKMNKLYEILDFWVEVQRQWIDLYGIFDKKSGVRQFLLSEYTKFFNVSAEFVKTLKIIHNSTTIIEIVSITDLPSVLQKISNSLVKITKALNEFLEKQRELFPRFYFIGNEDLLEIIGNMGNINRISKHFRKMFPGVFNVRYNKSNSSIEAVISQEGEIINLENAVSLTEYTRLDEWMTQLEYQIRFSIASILRKSITSFETLEFGQWLQSYPLQVLLLTLQINWTSSAESSMESQDFSFQQKQIENNLKILSNHPSPSKRKYEALIIELIHHKDVLNLLSIERVGNINDLRWSTQQRFYFEKNADDILISVKVKQSTKTFVYGFEYLGDMERLVYTPLLNNCFVAMSSALDQGLGGSPFGPAGTGKTETVKALAQNLGKMMLVFNCDESFDFQAIGRLLLGISQIGGWGCFDEFNRLDQNILSAVSSQIEQIELAIRGSQDSIELLDKKTKVSHETGIFITMNPFYSGRVTLPENLKKLFRSFSMQKPDSEIIAEVLLRARGFHYARDFSIKIVAFFQNLNSKLSKQQHYEFGLRSLKNTLEHAGKIKCSLKTTETDELRILVKSCNEILLPRLVTEDVELFIQSKVQIFGEVEEIEDELELRTFLETSLIKDGLICSKSWMKKALQLFKIQETQQGVILVGRAGSGKSVLWKYVLKALSMLENVESMHYVIDPKVLTKHELFGHLEPITREWVDGLLTSIIRKHNEDLRGELKKNSWIIFDGDVDPNWVESLNSVLDDNKILTLPNGERLTIPENIRFIFEVDRLSHATPATISRCGMVWIEDDFISTADLFKHELYLFESSYMTENKNEQQICLRFVETLKDILKDGVLESLIKFSLKSMNHIMTLTSLAIIRNLFIYIKSIILRKAISSPALLNHKYHLSQEFIIKAIIISLVWCMSGSSNVKDRIQFCLYLKSIDVFAHKLPESDGELNILEYDISLEGQWFQLSEVVPDSNLESHSVVDPNTVVETIDTISHENLIFSVLQQKKSLILCGPPGSGKTMTLYSALRRIPDISVANLNFSKDTEPSIVLRALEQLCEYKRYAEGYILKPKSAGTRVVVFADELNLPKTDIYGTQRVISLLRQIVEKNGFWKDKQWIKVIDIQFVGACNPSADAGRSKLTDRFLEHLPVIMIDFPGYKSLHQIYSAFATSVLKHIPQLLGFASDITNAMLDVYTKSSERFTKEQEIHYIYSPRELTRWIRGIYSAIHRGEFSTLPQLLRLWAHEAIRLFSDRLTNEDAKRWTWKMIKSVATKRFPNVSLTDSLKRPILYSNWLSLNYESVNHSSMLLFIKERFHVFSDEVLDVEFVLYDEAVDHILRIDRVLKQPQGHLILVGPSSSGKTTLAKFVAWINGLKIQQLTVTRNYTLKEFDLSLKDLLKRAGVNGEKICFIVDESTILEGSFLERMNSLLANSQIQEIFDPDEYIILMNLCKDQINTKGLLLDSQEEIYSWFTQQVADNLHVVFTINDSHNNNSPQIVSSPALFNRCVLNWMGNWSDSSLLQVSSQLLQTAPIDKSDYLKPSGHIPGIVTETYSHREAVIDCFITIHKNFGNSPGKLIEFIRAFSQIFQFKETELQEYQRHINSGLVKLKETVLKVKYLKTELSEKESKLKSKEVEARALLNKILSEQSEAERKQEASIEIQHALEKQKVLINEQRNNFMEDLSLAEPAVLEARKGVKNIKKQHLTELRSMSSPPATVQLTLESVCVLLGYDVRVWRDVLQVIRKDDFIANIVNFDCETQVTPEVREFMEANYLRRKEYTFEAANRASQACGPLFQWVEAQVKYSWVLEKITPLKEHVLNLENDSIQTKARLLAIEDMINELEESIDNYKNGYSDIIRDVEIIKQEMIDVQAKVSRSMELVDDLTLERTRWSNSIQQFDKQRSFITGNSLLSAGFLTYAGTMNYKDRELFFTFSKDLLSTSGITFDPYMTINGYLSDPNKLLDWTSNGLSNDDLFLENATILENTTNVPYIIDPFGQFIDVLSQKISSKGKLVVTSFLNDSFVRTLENALRFGGFLLIQDAEYFDPVISPILNNDFQKVGGRTLINIGGRSIDYANDFQLYLHTSDQSAIISSFVHTRTTIIDFSITDLSLERQTTNMTLLSERPDIEKQRIEMIRLESEYKLRLRELEDSLLTSLSESSGDLLQNQDLVDTLQKLKIESKEVETKAQETADVMSDIEKIAFIYQNFSSCSSLLFTVVNSLKLLNQFYQFSLTSYVKNIKSVLADSTYRGGSESKRVSHLVHALYKEVYSTYSISLKSKDKIIFGLALSLVYISEKDGELYSKFVYSLLQAFSYDEKFGAIKNAFSLLSIELSEADLLKFKSKEFKHIDVDIKDFEGLITALVNGSSNAENEFYKLSSILDSGNGPFMSKYNLEDIIKSTSPNSAIILGSSSSFDPTFKVRNLAKLKVEHLDIISLGSEEALKIASRELESRSRMGGWLVIQNVQTSLHWLESLEKLLTTTNLHESFRLFLTCEISPLIPTTLLKSSNLLVFENVPGIKTIIREYFFKNSKSSNDELIEKRHIIFLLCWFHSVLQERSRLAPIGFTKKYDFNDSDFEAAEFFINRWFGEFAKERTNIAPEKIDWEALRFYISEIAYGGKIDVTIDLDKVKSIANDLFTLESFDADFSLIHDKNTSLPLPEGRTLQSYSEWIDGLPNLQPSTWLGLELDAEENVKITENLEIIRETVKLYDKVLA